MTIYLISKDNQMINDAFITRAKFVPASHRPAGTIDDETGKSLPEADFAAELNIYLNEATLENREGYDGTFLGCGTKAKEIFLRGLSAELLWEAMKKSAYAI